MTILAFLLTLKLFQTCMTKEDNLKNVSNQIVYGSHRLGQNTVEVNGYRQLFGY